MALPSTTAPNLTILPVDCFARMARRPGAVWLDSSASDGGWGKCSILATDPVDHIVWDGDGNIGGILDELERIRRSDSLTAVGCIDYEATLPLLGVTPKHRPGIPMLHFMVYDRVLRYDHITGEYSNPFLALRFMDTCPIPNDTSTDLSAKIEPTVTREAYVNRVARIKDHIHEGDIYQANLTCRIDAYSKVEPFAVYLRMRRLNRSSYSAYLNFGDRQVLSSSPERMFLWDEDGLRSSPIKGTIGRSEDRAVDTAHREQLLASPKDRAELLMIVDLVRNDLGKIARTGSVRVENLYRLQQLESMYHLVADISTEPKQGLSLGQVIEALLPGGSITGAPKKRAVEIINELESTPRSVYTGCVGYVGGGRADFNIAIRTMVHSEGCYQIHAGGGVVADSDPGAEYDEMLLKARNLLRAVEGKL